jgi:hypothetical protein
MQAIVDTPNNIDGIYGFHAILIISNFDKSSSFLLSLIIFNALGVALTAKTVVPTTPTDAITDNIVDECFLKKISIFFIIFNLLSQKIKERI